MTVVQYVDIDTGEIISKSLYEREYIKIRNESLTKIVNNYGIRECTTVCERDRQRRFDF